LKICRQAQQSVELSRQEVLETRLLVAPTNEQRRIVEKIDELFSQIEAGERALEQARRLLDRYRQSVLKAAVTGELTRDWRERHGARSRTARRCSPRPGRPGAEAGNGRELERMRRARGSRRRAMEAEISRA
jgi:type I restriction enzyme S subunit